jgi:hypothetical protein
VFKNKKEPFQNNLLFAPRTNIHSEKPDEEVYSFISNIFNINQYDRNKLYLFGRKTKKTWDICCNQKILDGELFDIE